MMCEGRGYCEVHSYIWYDSEWLKTIEYEPGRTLELRNAAAAGQERLRREMAPNMLAFVDRNRHFFGDIRLCEIGSVFEPGQSGQDDAQYRHMMLARAERTDEGSLLKAVKADVETWVQQVTGRGISYQQVPADKVLPWESPLQTVQVMVEERVVGRITVVPVECRLRIDQHLRRLGIVMAELRLNSIVDLEPPITKLGQIPTFPEVELDFSVLTPAERHYVSLADQIRQFGHPLLRRVWFVDSYEGASVPVGMRSITLRARLGDAQRTLADEDLTTFRQAFVQHLESAGLKLR